MKRFAAHLLTAASVMTAFTVVQFEARTGLSSAWERPENRKLLEERMKLNHTNLFLNHFHEAWFKSNVTEVQKYSDAYLCQSKKDVTKCKPVTKK